MTAPTPIANETQPDFAVRFHDEMEESIPETDVRDRAMIGAWREANGPDPLCEVAAQKFGRDHDYHPDCSTAFVEHTIKDKDGNTVIYDRRALVSILERNNERIADTGDFCPITEGHNPSQEAKEQGAKIPDVLGYAGPCRLGMIGNKHPRWAIFNDEWHDKTEVEKLSKLRRRSPEIWMEKRMEDRFYDPLAALGASTPRLDMGMSWYTRNGNGEQVMKYAAAMPSSDSVFVTDTDLKKDNYESGESPMISNEDIHNITEAFMNTEPMKWVAAQMESAPQNMEGDDMPGDGIPGAVPAAAPAVVPDAAPDVVIDADHEDDPNEFAKRKYECDDEDRDMTVKYMSGDCPDEEYMSYCSDKRQKYQSDDKPDDKLTEVEPYSKPSEDREMQRTEKANYSKLQKDLEDANSRIGVIESEKRTSERYSKLQGKRVEFVFDINKEVERCGEKMSDDAFEDHLDIITENYERIPVESQVPLLYTPDSAVDPNDDKVVARNAEKAVKYCKAERSKGNQISYEDALQHVTSEAG